MALNCHRILFSEAAPSYLANLAISEAKETALRDARDKIREALRGGLRDWPQHISKGELFEDVLASITPPALQPKFRMQGSFVYRTCNDPASKPPQEIDLDDGMFLPISFLNRNGSVHPAVVSQALFRTVESILTPLCKRMGWHLSDDKPSCVRVQIAPDAHVDIALYAIPDEDFRHLVEKALLTEASALRDSRRRALQDDFEIQASLYDNLIGEHIMLAHREEGWKPSDPRKLEAWYQAAVEKHGAQLRRISRYLKGWRDFQWPACRLSSIALMAATVEAYERTTASVEATRDDVALLMVAELLPAFLSEVIANPVVPGQRLDESWTIEQRSEYVSAAKNLLHDVQASLRASDQRLALTGFTKLFGDRIPRDISLILSEPNLETKGLLAAPAILKLSESERIRRAEVATQEIQTRAVAPSKPWAQNP